MTKTQQTASEVAAEEGEVHVDGPDGVAYSMTAGAAAETGHRLLDGADQARAQIAEAGREGEQVDRKPTGR